MKKLLCLLLAGMFVLGMSTAFAQEQQTAPQDETYQQWYQQYVKGLSRFQADESP